MLERHGWDRALVTVVDEAAAEDALALLGHDAGAGKTQDAEACARRDGRIYVLGSQFGVQDRAA